MTDTSDSASGGVSRAAVLVPGRSYPVESPLLYFAQEAVEVRDGYVEPVRWTAPELDQAGTRAWLTSAESEAWVCGQVSDALARVEKSLPGAATVLVGKSLGTRAASVAADRGLPAIWLTPLLHTPRVVAELGRSEAPFLLVGGTEDEAWDGAEARRLTPHVAEIPGADHGMLLPGPLAASLAAHAVVATAIEHFLDTVVWPTG
ncbi:alpha/beta hydrolase [Actinocatenispora sera]|uniref:Alpha/beta hydrolase n=1 Tax=Actinocatenispora sera TaxID=390989 RepID=A0A810L7R8_9ACTN|nr:alpha/beta hydrolase [Actinocatenispora sera]BCJ31353.1 hypothetical protein Asera_54610 [Actinocatenispora sera]